MGPGPVREAGNRESRPSRPWVQGAVVVTVLVVLVPALSALPLPRGIVSRPWAPSAGTRATSVPLSSPALDPPTIASFGDWPAEAHDGARTGYNALERTLAPSNISGLHQIWSVRLPGHVYSSPIVVNGTVYIGDTDGYLYALDAANGSQRWRTELGGPVDVTNCRGLGGIADTAAYWNGTIYVGGGNPALYAVNATTGAILWSTDIANDSSGLWQAHYNWATPLLAEGSAYVGVASGCDTPLVAGQVLRINLTGATHPIAAAFWATTAAQDGGGIWRGPSVDPATGYIYATTGNENASCSCAGQQNHTRALLELDPTTLHLEGYWQGSSVGCDCDFGTSAAIADVGPSTSMIEATNKDGTADLFTPSDLTAAGDGSPFGTFSIGGANRARSGAAFDGQTLYLAGGATTIHGSTSCAGSINAFALSPSLTAWPSPTWQYCAPNDVQAGLAAANGLLVSFAVNTPTWTTDKLQIVNASSGALLYSTGLNQSVFSGAAIADGRIFFGTINGSTQSGSGYVDAYGLDLSASFTASAPGGTLALHANGSGGAPPYACSWAFGDGSSGVGCATTKGYAAAGTYTVALRLTDADGDVATASQVVTVVGTNTSGGYFVATATPLALDVGVPLRIAVSVYGGTPPFTYTYTGLPPGCAPTNASTLDCQPTSAGVFGIAPSVQDATGANLTGVGPSPEVTVASDPVLTGFGALPSTIRLGNGSVIGGVVVGGTSPFNFTYAGLPAGCPSRNASAFACVPTTIGTYPIELTSTDAVGSVATGTATLVVEPGGSTPTAPLTLVDLEVDPASITLGGEATVVVLVTGGEPPYTYDFAGLPTGCSRGSDEVLLCSPTSLGTYDITVNASDQAGAFVVGNASLTVSAAPAPGIAATGGPPLLTLGAALAAGLVGLVVGAVVGVRRGRTRARPERPPGGAPP